MRRSSGIVVLLLVAGCAAPSSDDQFKYGPSGSDGGKTADGGKLPTNPGKDGGTGGGKSDGGVTPPGDDDDDDDTSDSGVVTPPGDSGVTPPVDSGTTGPVTGGLAQGLTITDIAIFQGSKVPLVKGGAVQTPKYVPVVAGRQGLLRVYVSGTTSKAVTAELTLTSSTGTTVLKDANRTLSGASTDATLGTTFNIDIPQGAIAKDTTYSVRLVDPSLPTSSTSSGAARYPNDGSQATMGAQNDGASVTITLVPVRYNADGSGRLPDTTAAQLKIYSDFLLQTYPVANLDVQVHAPVDYSGTIGATSSSQWSQVLNFVLDLRDSDNVAANNYYYGIFQPAAADASGGLANYCRGGCILGIAPLTSNANDTSQRGGVGAGYKGLEFATTLAQEIGHSCGINHAPYPAAGSQNAPASPDPAYPYAGALIGQWGYGFIDKKLYNPATYRDFMSYADNNIWVSDYVQGLFFKRFKTVNHATSGIFQPRRYERIYLWEDGGAEFGATSTLRTPPEGEAHTVEFTDASGSVIGTAQGQYFGLDTGDGGYLMVPDAPAGYTTARVQGFGGVREVRR